MLRKIAKQGIRDEISALGNAILAGGNAIFKSGNAFPEPGIAFPEHGIALPKQVRALLKQSIVRSELGIAHSGHSFTDSKPWITLPDACIAKP